MKIHWYKELQCGGYFITAGIYVWTFYGILEKSFPLIPQYVECYNLQGFIFCVVLFIPLILAAILYRKFPIVLFKIDKEGHRRQIYINNKGLFIYYVIHPSTKVGYYDIDIRLIRHKSVDFSDIKYVEFFFGPKWGNKKFRVENENNIIAITTSAYAPFLCMCYVKFKNGSECKLNQYIYFETTKKNKEILTNNLLR